MASGSNEVSLYEERSKGAINFNEAVEILNKLHIKTLKKRIFLSVVLRSMFVR